MIIFGERFEVMLDGERALEFVRAQGPWGAVVGIGLIVVDLVVPVPTPAIMTALGLIYGPFVGGALASFGSFIAALIGYTLCRAIGPRAASWIAGKEEIERMSGFFDKYGLWAIALSRWAPALPEVLACLAGLSRMSFWRFSLGNLIGSAAVGFAYAGFGASGADNPAAAFGAAILLPYLALPIFFAWIAHQRRGRRRTEG
jgi:uncharacterized membrane protein YdjX (TVP38/TMEM64 family)